MKVTVRHLVVRPGPAGGLPRYFWQPSSKLRQEGWRPERVPLDHGDYADAGALEAAAIARARVLNDRLDRARAAAALAASRPVPPPAARSVADLVAAYRASDSFTRLAATTQRGYRQCLAKIEAWGEGVPVHEVKPANVRRLIDSMRATPAYANAVARVLQAAFKFGRLHGWVEHNPATNMGLRGADPSGLIWPAEAVAAFVACADAMGLHSVGDAVILNEWLGQREADILRLPRAVYREGGLIIRQHKTRATVMLPVDRVPLLKARMEDIARRNAARERRPGAVAASTVVVSEATGRPYKADNFRHVFSRVRARLAETHPSFELGYLLPGRDMTAPDAFSVRTEALTFMHLRHTAVVRLAEAGVELPGIASITGHALATLPRVLRHYLPRTAELARLAFDKRLGGDPVAPEHRQNRPV